MVDVKKTAHFERFRNLQHRIKVSLAGVGARVAAVGW